MRDDCFAHPRLAAIYDPLDPDLSDLDAYLDMAEELDAHRVLDIGCGTGVFALRLADREIEVVGVDPARGGLCNPRFRVVVPVFVSCVCRKRQKNWDDVAAYRISGVAVPTVFVRGLERMLAS